MKINIEECKRKYGTVTFENKEYVLTENPFWEYRSHNVNGWQMQYPENYLMAHAVDNKGNEYRVWWFIEDTNVELDSIDYDNVTDVEEV